MQVARIVPNIRTTKEAVFDYDIPPQILPMINIGILVEVPFHGRKIEGIVVGLKRRTDIEKIKPITTIIDSTPVVDDVHIQLAKWMSDYYLASFGKALFENIVPPAKRAIKNKKNSIIRAAAVKVEISKSSKKYLIVSDFQSRLKFYLSAINKTLAKDLSVIILVPDLALIPYFTKYLKTSISILHADMTKTQRWIEWNRIREGKTKIVIGSQSALFAPVKNLGLIIIDQEENEAFKNDRSPRFHTADVAKKLCDLTRANFILGSLAPRVETYYQAVKDQYRIFHHQRDRGYNKKDITIVDMNSEKFVISNILEKEIENQLRNRKRILLVLNRKGEGTKFSCPDCGWIALCKKCGLPLIPQRAGNVCYRCKENYPVAESCPKCQSVHLKPTGLGTARLKKFLTDLFFDAKIIQIEKELDGKEIFGNWDIAIATSYALKFKFPPLGLVALIDADQGLNFPDFNSAQKSFGIFYKFLRLGRMKIIQTHLNESKFIRDLAKMDYGTFFLEELESRKKFQFPPFAKMIRLEYHHVDEEKCKNESQKVYNVLSKFGLDVTTPYIPFISRKLNRYRFQILIKYYKDIPAETKNVLKNLRSPWIVDVDPVSLI